MVKNWQEDYKRKLCSFEEAAKLVQSGDSLFNNIAAGACSGDLYNAIIDRADELTDVTILDPTQLKPSKLMSPEVLRQVEGHITYAPGHSSIALIKANKMKALDFFPVTATDSAIKMGNRTNICCAMVTPPNANGYVNLGLSCFCVPDFIKIGRANGILRTVIGEVNDQMPIVYGDNWIHVSQFDGLIENSTPIPVGQRETANEKDQIIGQYVRELIEDRSTLQMGWGGITEAVVSRLDGVHDLGVLSEMFPAGLNNLTEKGIVTNKYKPEFQGISIASLCVGDQDLYDFVTENPQAQLYPSSFTNMIPFISKHPKMVAVNGAIAVDLSGQVCAEGMGHTMISGSGGQLEYMIGAAYSNGGKGINLLYAARENHDGSLSSNIMAEFPAGTPVTVPRMYSDYVITEYGIAHLRYKTRRERAGELISIAHPDLRGELRSALKKNFYPGWYN